MAISLVQQATASNGNLTVTQPLAGSLLVCCGVNFGGSLWAPSGGGVTWKLIDVLDSTSNAAMYYGYNASGSGDTAITLSNPGFSRAVWFGEFSGLSITQDPLEFSGGTQQFASLVSTNGLETSPSDLVIMMAANDAASNINSASNGYALQTQANSTNNTARLRVGYVTNGANQSTFGGSRTTWYAIIANFATPSPNGSVQDCRNYATFPNKSRNLNGTRIFDINAQPSHPYPLDSRANGGPIASAPSVYPQNSRSSNVASNFFLDFRSASLPSGVSFSRSSIGTYFNSSGILTTASANAARFNYSSSPSATGTFLGLLVEPAATNLLLQSNGFSTTWFAQNSGVLTANAFTSPDGTNDGWSLTSGAGFGGRGQAITFSNTPYTMSVWAEQLVGTPPLELVLNNVNTGNITTSGTIARYSGTLTPAAGSNNAIITVNAVSGSTMGIFGAQLETGPTATSYIPTTTGQATRAADVVSFTIPSSVGHLIYTFDDGSTQTVAVTPGSYTVPTNLNRPNILYIQGAV